MKPDHQIRHDLLRGVGRLYLAHPTASFHALMLVLLCPFRCQKTAAQRLGISVSTVETHVRYLREAGLVCCVRQRRRLSEGRGGSPGFYDLTEKGRALFSDSPPSRNAP